MGDRAPKYLSRASTIVVRPAPGWVEVVAGELREFASNPCARYKFSPEFKIEKGAIRVSNVDFRQAIEWTMRSTTAHDVEWVAYEGKCNSWRDLGKACEALRGYGFLPSGDGPVSAHAGVKANASFVVSSAVIRARFCEAFGLRHDDDAALRFRLDLYRDRLTVLVSLGGEPLYKRGYKKHLSGAVAPLPEHQAAACIRAAFSGMTEGQGRAVYVPFAGTGTLAFEWMVARLGAGNAFAGRRYAFDEFAGVPVASVAHIRKKLAPQKDAACRVACVERSDDVAGILRENVESFCSLAKIDRDRITVATGDFFKADSEAPLRELVRQAGGEGSEVVVLLNPPYGQRLKAAAEARKYFARVADRLLDLEMKTGAAISGFCMIPDEAASATFVKGLRKTHDVSTSHFTHGGADVRLVVFRHQPVGT